ncbi:FAD:protein FMN transferase [Reinekea sp.]|jgi:thiamine biosynthesis lipoprotein|uniref:FAD:protein FMN transferase n=1 Tax=Reinekea sp. TaxID=1970455 RepID=UPI003989D96A
MNKFTHEFIAMGGPCEVSFWLASNNAHSLKDCLEREVRRLETKYSRFDETSLLSQINQGKFNRQPLDEETTALLNYAQQCYELSDGLFDITVGSFRSVWNFKINKLPSLEEIEEVRSRIGWPNIGWDGQTLEILNQAELDLGGMVKEFAVDRLVNILLEHQAIGLVNLAGDIGVTGLQVDGSPWHISVVHPRVEGGVIATVELHGGAIACSGDYERFMIVDGCRYHHLINPKTGYPSLDSLASISVITQNCLMAGSISTIAMLKGAQAKAWLQEMELPYLAIEADLSLFGSIGV